MFVRNAFVTVTLAAMSGISATAAEEALPPIAIQRAEGSITIDGDLSDPAWKNAAAVTQWFETRPGDNVEPQVANVAYITYDDRFLYVAFDFSDPDPKSIRAPLGDHDQISGASMDFAGVMIDARNDGKTAMEFLATPSGVQFDAVLDDASGNEDASPDFFWDTVGKITAKGWQMEMRIPFSTLRYENANPAAWGIMFYRNYPRDRRYQFFGNRIPRGNSCLVCHARKLVGLQGLPGGGHIIAAPYVTAGAEQHAADLGSPLGDRTYDTDIGADLKWTPNADTALDLTLNPDFSQVESDVAEISANERFAIFFPEKRPFFLEGVELLATPIQAVYTRTITSPKWGVRSTGTFGDRYAYTVLASADRGGGSVVLPGPLGSGFADQDFSSNVAIARIRRSLNGNSFASILFTDRENEGHSHNRVLGPDFQWRPNDRHTLTGQLLFSQTRDPNRPDLEESWTGEERDSHAGMIWYQYQTSSRDLYLQYEDLGEEFRADAGFVPQVGHREAYAEGGHTVYPKGFLHRIRTFVIASHDEELDGDTIFDQISVGFGSDGKRSSFYRLRPAFERVQSGGELFDQLRLYYELRISPTRNIVDLYLQGWLGEGVDFAQSRSGEGANVALGGSLRAGDHLQFEVNSSLRWLDLDAGRLFTAQVQRLKTTYTFDSRRFVRAIVQHVRTDRNDALYEDDVTEREGNLTSSILFAYKLNWQSVLFIGYGEDHGLEEDGALPATGRNVFLKMSYAFQR